jgi:hypothetical protein
MDMLSDFIIAGKAISMKIYVKRKEESNESTMEGFVNR